MKLRKKYFWAWIAWLLLFAVIELKAILDDDEDEGDYTLSHYLRRGLAAAKPAKVGNWIFRAVVIGVFAWLIPHLNLPEMLMEFFK